MKYIEEIKDKYTTDELKHSLFRGDNREILKTFPNECVDLIYMDPPFFSLEKYFASGHNGKVEAYSDMYQDIETYKNTIKESLIECHRVLKSTGSIYVHCDHHASHYIKVMIDDIFGYKNFQNEIIWHYGLGAANRKRGFLKKHDNILYYSKSNKFTFNMQRGEITPAMKAKYCHEDSEGKYMMSYGKKYYLKGGKPFDDVWEKILSDDILDIPTISATSKERLGIRTQKPEALLERIIKASSNPGDLILDPFCGCGTSVSVAQKLGRRWIGIDVSPKACKVISKRIHDLGYRNEEILDLPKSIDELKEMSGYELQDWVVQKIGGYQEKRRSGDGGIDGFTFDQTPIQVKNSYSSVSTAPIRQFEHDIREINKVKGVFVAFSFTKTAQSKVDHIKSKFGIDIKLVTVNDLLNGWKNK